MRTKNNLNTGMSSFKEVIMGCNNKRTLMRIKNISRIINKMSSTC